MTVRDCNEEPGFLGRTAKLIYNMEELLIEFGSNENQSELQTYVRDVTYLMFGYKALNQYDEKKVLIFENSTYNYE